MGSIERKVERIGNIAFMLGIILETMFVVLDKSAYILQHQTLDFRFTFLLFAIKIATTKYNKKEWIGIFFLIALGTVSWYVTGREEIIRIVALVTACKNTDMRRVLKIVCWETFIGCMILMILSMLGLFGTLAITDIFRGGGIEETRYCFGLGHPNAFHCMLIMMILLFMASYEKELKWWGYALMLEINFLAMRFTDSRTGFLIGCVIILLAVVLHYSKNIRETKLALILSGVMIIGTMIYLSIVLLVPIWTSDLLWKIDEKLNGRMWWAFSEGGLPYWTLFSNRANTFFFDMGLIRIVYWYGIIPALVFGIVLVGSIYLSWKNKHFDYLLIILAFFLYSVMEAHGVSEFIGRNYSFLCIGALLPEFFEKDKNTFSVLDILGRFTGWNRNSN